MRSVVSDSQQMQTQLKDLANANSHLQNNVNELDIVVQSKQK